MMPDPKPDDDNYVDPEDEEEETDPLRCPDCGGYNWSRTERGHFIQTRHVDTNRRWNDSTSNEEMDTDSSDTWFCDACDTEATFEADDAITEFLRHG